MLVKVKVTEQDSKLIQMLADDMSRKQIAEVLGISRSGVAYRIAMLYGKLGVRNIIELIRFAIREKIMKP